MRPLAGGSTVAVLAADLDDGSRVVVKAGDAPLALEAWMLGELARLSSVPLPAVLHVEPDLLLLEWIPHDPDPPGPAVETHAAEILAALHMVAGPAYGYARDTTIGRLHQPNPWMERWVAFYGEVRLRATARGGVADGTLDPGLARRIERLADRLDRWLVEPERPALLHGDVWTGNLLHRDGRVIGLIDPALYYGHPEVELAYATMFGTLGDRFLDAYAAIVPGHDPGFRDVRAAIYRIYPQIVHVRTWDRDYARPIAATLDRLGL